MFASALEIMTVNIFHRQVVTIFMNASVIDRNNVRVNKLADNLRLAHKSLAKRRVFIESTRHDFERDFALKDILYSQIYGSHPTSTQSFGDFVTWDFKRH